MGFSFTQVAYESGLTGHPEFDLKLRQGGDSVQLKSRANTMQRIRVSPLKRAQADR
jgi:hypothetical protein